MPMGDLLGVVVETEDSSSSQATSASGSSTGLQKFLILLKKIACRNAFTSILITLSIASVSMYVYNSMLFKRLPFSLPERLLLSLLLVCCTIVFSRLIVTALIFSVERYLVMKTNKALYFVFALKKSVGYFFYCSSLLSSWMFFIKPDMTGLAVHSFTSTLTTLVIAIAMWVLKIAILKELDCQFHDENFFLNIQDLISHEYILQTLLGPSRGTKNCSNCTMRAQQLQRIKEAFANMLLVFTRLHTICDALDNSNFDDDEHQLENTISKVYKNLTNNELRDIQETDLLRVMKEEDIPNVLQLFEGTNERKNISEASLRKWMVKVCSERKLVVHHLNKTSNVIHQLNKIVVVNLSFLVALLWCLLMGIGTSKYLGYISSSHLLVLAYIFGDYCKFICEGIMQAIVMHPFDIGDHCIIDNEQLVVEEIGLTYTVFVKDNNEKINCPNSALITKSVSNLSRSSGLKDTFELLVSSLTSLETIAALKLKINELLQNKPGSWHAEFFFYLKAIDNVTHIYNLEITRATSIQNYNDGRYLRSQLLLKLREVLDELDIQDFSIQ